jgi:hypothetical protein
MVQEHIHRLTKVTANKMSHRHHSNSNRNSRSHMPRTTRYHRSKDMDSHNRSSQRMNLHCLQGSKGGMEVLGREWGMVDRTFIGEGKGNCFCLEVREGGD